MGTTPTSPPQIGPRISDEGSLAILTRCQDDPIFFVTDILGITPTEDQESVLLALKEYKRVSARSCNNVGKTAVGAMAVLWFGFSFAPCKIITTATVGRQVKAQIWSEIHRLYYGSKYDLGGELKQQEWYIRPDSIAIGFTTDREDRFQGWHSEHLLFVLDEASGLSPKIFDGAEGSMGGAHARMLAMGNPLRPDGEFYKTFKTDGWTCLKMAAERHPNIVEGREVIPGGITREWIESRREMWGEDDPRYVARVLGDFPDVTEDTLIRLTWVEAAMKREHPKEIDPARLHMGVDIARSGPDRIVLLIRDDYAVRYMETAQHKSLMDTSGRILQLAKRWGIQPEHVHIDDVGLGGGVVDRLIELDFGCHAVNFGSKASDSERFANLRAEAYWHTRDAVDPNRKDIHLAIPSQYHELAREMTMAQREFTSRGQIKLEPKEKIIKRLGRSPDLVDALALSYSSKGWKPVDIFVPDAEPERIHKGEELPQTGIDRKRILADEMAWA